MMYFSATKVLKKTLDNKKSTKSAVLKCSWIVFVTMQTDSFDSLVYEHSEFH